MFQAARGGNIDIVERMIELGTNNYNVAMMHCLVQRMVVN